VNAHAEHAVMRNGSKSFAFATRLLGREAADRAAIIYAWCRRADDAVDEVPAAEAPAAVARLRAELDAGGDEFAAVRAACGIPRMYADAMLDGMAADAAGTRYATWRALDGYCYQVASSVGLMMCHVFGLRDERALIHAAHLGIAMQLTNICRDVAEDWARGRLYLPDELVPGLAPSGPLPRERLRPAIAATLQRAEAFYASGDRGIRDLPWRAGLAVRAARRIYARIGREIERRGCDPLAGRAVVPGWRKGMLALGALGHQLVTWSRRPARAPRATLSLGEAVSPPPDVSLFLEAAGVG